MNTGLGYNESAFPPMNNIVAVDFDDTYTTDPEFFSVMCNMMRNRGWKVYIVTARDEKDRAEVEELAASSVDAVFCTGGKAKQMFMYRKGIIIDFWIDDNPTSIIKDIF